MTERTRVVAAWLVAIGLAACQPGAGSTPSAASAAASSEAEAGAGVDASPTAALADASADSSKSTSTSTSADAGTPDGMLLVNGGTFTMGSEVGGEGDEKPAHAVKVAAFWLDRTEVTQSAYDACVADNVCPAPDPGILASFGGAFKGPNKPVIGVTWFAARDYCKWKGKRLPREAEYERAVRGEDGRRFPWGNEAPTHERTVFEANTTDDVGKHPSGKGPYGHEDLAGNVWEWIDDDYDPFAYSRSGAAEGKPGTCDEIIAAQNKLRAEDKQGFTGSNPIPTACEKSIRGGAYNYPASGLRSTNRIHHPPSFKLRMTGLRCAKDA